MTQLQTWKELVDILCPRGAGLFEEVTLAIEDPDGYFEEFHEELSGRGIDDASGVSPWLALIDGLQSRGCLAEVDWREEAAEVVVALEELSICRDKRVDLESLAERAEQPETLLPEIAELLDQYELALGSPYLDSDSWPLVVFPKGRIPEVERLVATLKEKLSIVVPKARAQI